MSGLVVDDPRRARDIVTRIRGAGRNRKAHLFIDGQRWAIIEWGGPQRWCIEDDQHLCLDHIENAPGDRTTLQQAIALAEAMIRDGRMPAPEEAKRLNDERLAQWELQNDVWKHPERLYEPLADVLELWGDKPDLVGSNSYAVLRHQLLSLADAAVAHFDHMRSSAERDLAIVESGRRSVWHQSADAYREKLAYAQEHLTRAREILRTHAPERAL